MSQVELPNTKDIEEKSQAAIVFAKALIVQDNESYLLATEFVKGLKGLEKQVKSTFAEPKKLTDQAHKSVVAAESMHLTPIKAASDIANPKIAHYLQQEAIKREEEQKRLQAEVDRREEDERLQQAVQVEQSGDKEGAKQLLDLPLAAPTVILPSSVPKAQGVSMSYRYSARVVDSAAFFKLVEFVAHNRQYLGLLLPNQSALNQLAVAQKESLIGILPGVDLVKAPIMSYRTQ